MGQQQGDWTDWVLCLAVAVLLGATPMRWLKSRAFFLLAVVLWIPAYFLPPVLQKTGHTPPVGVYIAIAGLVAAATTLRKDPRPIEKAAWIIVVTLATVAEIRNLYVADTEQTKKFEKISDGLRLTKEGLEAAASSLRATATGMKELLGQTTGGNSYIYFSISGGPWGPIESGADKGLMLTNAFPTFVGSYPLHNVFVATFCSTTRWLPNIDYGTMFPGELGRPREGLQLRFLPEGERQFCKISINTSNGSYEQQILFLKQGNKWGWASLLFKRAEKEPVKSFASPEFPKHWQARDWYNQ